MSETSLSMDAIDRAAQDDALVALHLRQTLQPIEGPGSVFFPPTYAGVGYQINTLSDGSQVVEVDSVGSQANRMEPIFLREELRHLVPQIDILYGDAKKGTEGRTSLLQVGHRLGDALVRCTELQEEAHAAFSAYDRTGNATGLARLAPTSLVFGAWDSRDTMAKVPRLLQAQVRAFDVSALKRSAQFTTPVDYAALEVFSEEEKAKAEGKAASPLAERGFVHVPSIGDPGGVIAKGPIRRDVTINLVQLRRLRGDDDLALRRYLLGLALVAATEPMDAFLRQGCLLVPDPDVPSEWQAVRRDGQRIAVELDAVRAKTYAKEAALKFGVGESRQVQFDKKRAVADAKKADKKKKASE